MPRFHATPNGKVQFTEAEEKLQDDVEAKIAAEAPKLAIIKKITDLEKEITPRRIREAILGTDSDWLKNKEAEIATERSKL